MFNDPNIWTEPVESSLPYVEMLSHRKWKDAASSAAMLDEDRVIVTPVGSPSSSKLMRLAYSRTAEFRRIHV